MPEIIKITALAVLAATLTACHTIPDCDEAERLGGEIGGLGLPAEADRAGVALRCRGQYMAGWTAASKTYCDPGNGFDIGYSEAVYYGVCRDDAFRTPYRLGRTLRVLEVELQAAVDQLKSGQVDEQAAVELRRRQREISRELDELRTLARIRGHLEPAGAPEPLPDAPFPP